MAANTTMTGEQQKVKRPKITLLEIAVASAFSGFMGFRVTSVLILALFLAFYIAYPISPRPRLLIACCVAFFVSFWLPIDIALGSFTGHLYGSTHSGPRFVHSASTCMPMHHVLRQKYGEYATHISADGSFGPRWIFVWD